MKLVIVKVGNDSRPACSEDISDMAESVGETLKEAAENEVGQRLSALITHHAVTFETLDLPDVDKNKILVVVTK